MTFGEQLDALLDSTDLSKLGSDSTISQFWKNQIDAARQRAASDRPGEPLRVGDIVRALGFGFSPLPDGMSLRHDPELTMVLHTRRSHTLPALKQVRGDLSKEQWEHLRAISVLKDEGLLEDYFQFIKPFGIRSDMTAAKHYYYLTVVRRLIDSHLKDRPLHVLEIGAGAGNLAVFLLSLGIVSTYVIVDLPEMLLNAAAQLRTYSPHAEMFLDALPGATATRRKPHVSLLQTKHIARLPRNHIALALNFNSFMEMDQETRDFYISEIYRTAADGAIFYNVNRRQPALPLPDGSSFDSNPLLYPYDRRDEIIFWEDDLFQTAFRSWFGARPTLGVARAAVVRKRGTLTQLVKAPFRRS